MSDILFLTKRKINDFSFGGAQRANHLRNALMAHGAVDTIVIEGGKSLTMDNEWSANRARSATISAYGISIESLRQRRELSHWIGTILAGGEYRFLVAQYTDLASLVPRRWWSKMIFDPDDLVKSLPPDAPFSATVRLAIRNEIAQWVASRALHVWYVSSIPENLPRTSRRSYLPNVVGLPDPGRPRRKPVPNRLLMVGLFTYAPNVEGLSWFVDNVLPTLKERFASLEVHAVGRYEPSLSARLPTVHFHGYVNDLALEYDRASLVIAPIRSGGGTQIKVIEALAHGRPLISTTFAYSGFAEEVEAENHLRLADNASDWIETCGQMLVNQSQSEEIARRGAIQVASAYGPHRMVDSVGTTLAALKQNEANRQYADAT